MTEPATTMTTIRRRRSGVRAPRLVLLVLVIGAIAGCGGPAGDGHPVGAPSTTAQVGPTALVTPALPTLRPRATPTNSPATTSAAPLQPLVDTITAALADAERVPPNVQVSQNAAAGDQVNVSWIVSTDPNDAMAKGNVRTDAVKIMTVVKASNTSYGSVLLSATGTILEEEKRKDTTVVRAKFTQARVRSTDWAAVAPEAIFTLCDDKPADIAPAFS